MKTKSVHYQRRPQLGFHPGAIQVVNLVIAALLGFLLAGYYFGSDDYGLTLNFGHRMILGVTILILIFFALGANSKKVFWANILLGLFYLLSFLLGTLFGFPVLVNEYLFNPDEMFQISVPRILDLGLLDFYVHGLLGFAFLICAVFWYMLYRIPQSPNSGKPN